MITLFIGGTGNISAECARLLHERGHEVWILTRGRIAAPPGCKAIQVDRRDPPNMRKALRDMRPEVVINFLGYELADLEIDYDLFKGVVRQYLFISSTTVYAKPHSQLPLTEVSPLGNVFWDYARKKEECEHWLMERWAKEKFPVTIARPSHTYSKRWIPNPVSSASYTFASRLEQGKPVYVPDDGETPWTLTAAADFAAGLAGLVGNEAALGEAFHITSDEVLTWNRICAEIASGLGVERPEIVQVPTDLICQAVPRMVGTLKGDKANPGIFDNSKIKRFVPDFNCRVSFHDGVRQSIDWLRRHPDQQNLNPQVDQEIEAVLALWKHKA